MVKSFGVQRESEGVVVPVIGAQHYAPGGKGPCFDHACGEGKRWGMTGSASSNHPDGLSPVGLAAFGVDLSPAMIELARAAHPGLRFEVASMDALGPLGIADGSLGGVLSRYSIIHLPPERLPAVLAEFGRVLAPGGHLLLSFGEAEAGEDGAPGGGHAFYDHGVTGAYCWQPDYISTLLLKAGLVERDRMLTRPEATAKRQFRSVQLVACKADG